MRRVVLYQLVSVDGVAEAPDDWLFDVDDVLLENLAQVIGTQDAVLLGRRTYDSWAAYWPTAQDEPFAGFINGVAKHVVTSRAPELQWSGSVRVTAPLTEHVRSLTQQPGADIGVHGSISLAQSLLRAGLVDELRLVIAPAVAGRGRRLFEDDGVLRRLELVDVERTPSGALLVGYRATDGTS